jgi:hypothetical protein
LHGKKLDGPKEEVVVIPRQDGDLVFKARAVLDFTDFDKLCPTPEPPEVIKPGGIKAADPEDADYLAKLDEWGTQKSNWMILKSLAATEGLEWETVNMSDPKTWANYQQEMQDSGLSMGEVSRIVSIIMDACGLNQQKIDEATKRFLAGQAKEQEG